MLRSYSQNALRASAGDERVRSRFALLRDAMIALCRSAAEACSKAIQLVKPATSSGARILPLLTKKSRPYLAARKSSSRASGLICPANGRLASPIDTLTMNTVGAAPARSGVPFKRGLWPGRSYPVTTCCFLSAHSPAHPSPSKDERTQALEAGQLLHRRLP